MGIADSVKEFQSGYINLHSTSNIWFYASSLLFIYLFIQIIIDSQIFYFIKWVVT